MAAQLPERDLAFLKYALQLGLVTQEQAQSVIALQQYYLRAGGEVPSLPRILVAKQLISPEKAEQLLRQMASGVVDQAALAGGPSGETGLRPPSEERPAISVPPASRVLEEIDTQVGGALETSTALPPADDDPEAHLRGLGATVLRREIKGYKILEVVGEGSVGTVYKAHQISMDRVVALKVLNPEKCRDRAFVEQFLTEARSAGRLNHPNVIRVHEVGKAGDTYYYSMEYVDGLTIGELMDEFEQGRLEVRRAVNIFAQVAAALDHGYRNGGIIHREIRPRSIMVIEGDTAKLADLGLTREEARRFLEGENAHYVAPEQARSSPVDTRTDLYSTGCVLFHAVTGEPPFGGGEPREVLQRRLLLAEPPDPTLICPELPPGLARIIMKAMAREPEQRYQTPLELLNALRTVDLTPRPAAFRPRTGRTGRFRRFASRAHRPIGRRRRRRR